jgi:hypothetical protein
MPEYSPLFQSKSYDESIEKIKPQAVCDFVYSIKEEYYNSDLFKFFQERSEIIKYLINMVWRPKDKQSKFGIVGGIVNGAYTNFVDRFQNTIDQADQLLVMAPTNRNKQNIQIVEQLEAFGNNVLTQCDYQEHLMTRMQWVAMYGWSPARDEWHFNEGWAAQPKAASVGPGGFDWQKHWDVLLNKPMPKEIHPMDWFGSPYHRIHKQPFEGCIERWYIRDIHQHKAKVRPSDGKPLCNLDALQRIEDKLKRKESTHDENKAVDGKRGLEREEYGFHYNKRQAYVDVLRWRGSLFDVAPGDSNTYEIICTRNELIQITEQPVDVFKDMSHMQSMPFLTNPLSMTLLDPIVPYARMSDLIRNYRIENVIDKMHRYYAVWADDIENLETLHNPRELNSFLYMQDQGRLPRLVDDSRSGSYQDAKDLLQDLDSQRQIAGPTDTEMGAAGSGPDQTATKDRILMAASSKRIMGSLGRMMRHGFVPQAKNLTWLALTNYKPDQLRIMDRDDNWIPLNEQHYQAFWNGSLWRSSDTFTRNKWEDNQRATEFYLNAFKILSNIQDPSYAIKILRYLGKESGVKDIDENIPEPTPPEVTTQQPQVQPGLQPEQPVQTNGSPTDYRAMIEQARPSNAVA